MVTKVKSGVIGDNTVGITQLNVSDGSNGQVLTTNGSGTLSFSTISAGVDGISSSADATAITITSDEKVGIGATSPTVLLDVYNGSGWGGIDVDGTSGGEIRFQKAGTNYGQLYANDSSGFIINAPNGIEDIFLQAGGTTKLTIDSSGCTTSAGNFSFNPGTGNLGQRYMIINAGTSNDGGFILKRDDTNKWQIVNSTTDDDLWFYSYSTSSTLLTLDRSKPGLYINSTSQGSQSGPFFVQGGSQYACTGQFENTNSGGHYILGSTSGTSRWLIGTGSNSGSGSLANLAIKSHGGDIQFFASNTKHLTLYANGVLAAGTSTSDLGHNIVNYTTSGYLGLTGDLTGYSAGSYPTLKTNGSYIYFDIGGSYSAYMQSNGTLNANSDRRLKENITTLSSGQLAKVCALRGVNYTWIDERQTGTQVGVIAQEIQEEYPELVGNGGIEDGTLTVNYAGLVSPLIEAIKELKADNDALKARIETLENA